MLDVDFDYLMHACQLYHTSASVRYGLLHTCTCMNSRFVLFTNVLEYDLAFWLELVVGMMDHWTLLFDS